MMSDFVEVEEEFEEEAEEEGEGVDERKKKEPKKKVPLFKLQAKNSKNVSIKIIFLRDIDFNIILIIARQTTKSQTSQHKANAWTRQTQSR